MENERSYKKYRLDNGLLVASQKTPTQTVYGQLSVYFGAVYEKKGEEGLAHFFEHVLVSGGTKKYNSEEIEKIIDKLGYFNATTEIEETLFGGDFLSRNLESYLDIVSSIAFEPRFDKKVIEQERQRILREIAEYKTRPDYTDEKMFLEKFYGKGHPLTIEILGKERNINSFKQEDFVRFHLRGYNANNMELVLVGGLPENIEKLVENYFANKPAGKNKKFKFPVVKPLKKRVIIHSYATDLYNYENPEESNSHIRLGIVVPPRTHRDFAKVALLTTILEKKLFERISKKKGLAYSIKVGYHGDRNRGVIGTNSLVHSKRQEEAIDLIFNEFRKLQEKSLNSKEIDTEKEDVEYSFKKALESNEKRVASIRGELDHGMSDEELLAKFYSLTPKKIQDAAIKYLPKNRRDENYALLIRDPLKK